MVVWRKPKEWKKEFNGGKDQARGVVKKAIAHKDAAKVRNYIYNRWKKDS